VLAFGEEVKEAIPIFACDNNLKAAFFVALGALERAVSETPLHLKRHMRKDINVALMTFPDTRTDGQESNYLVATAHYRLTENLHLGSIQKIQRFKTVASRKVFATLFIFCSPAFAVIDGLARPLEFFAADIHWDWRHS